MLKWKGHRGKKKKKRKMKQEGKEKWELNFCAVSYMLCIYDTQFPFTYPCSLYSISTSEGMIAWVHCQF